jgi:hypothetical protein
MAREPGTLDLKELRSDDLMRKTIVSGKSIPSKASSK